MAVRKRLTSSFPQGTRLCWTYLKKNQNFIGNHSFTFKIPLKKDKNRKKRLF